MCIIVNQKQFRLLTISDLKNGHTAEYIEYGIPQSTEMS